MPPGLCRRVLCFSALSGLPGPQELELHGICRLPAVGALGALSSLGEACQGSVELPEPQRLSWSGGVSSAAGARVSFVDALCLQTWWSLRVKPVGSRDAALSTLALGGFAVGCCSPEWPQILFQ